jgi:hypothetical protein
VSEILNTYEEQLPAMQDNAAVGRVIPARPALIILG